MSRFLGIPHLVDAEHLPGGGAEHDPLAGDGANHDHLAVRGEAGGLGLLPHVVAPDHGLGEDVPHVQHPVMARRDELVRARGGGQGGHLEVELVTCFT